MKKIYHVVAAIIIRNGEILCGKRGKGFFESKWEFPGGKIEIGETKIQALQREIKEELGCTISECTYFASSIFECAEFDIYLDTYIVNDILDEPTANVHQEIRWISISKLIEFDWCDADKMIVKKILETDSLV